MSVPEISQRLQEFIVSNDLSKLTPAEFVSYYREACHNAGLSWIGRPFDFLKLNGRLVLYLNRAGAEQLRKNHNITIRILGREVHDGLIFVHAEATMPDGRRDEDYGTLPLPKGDPNFVANKWLHAVTKAKRRVTLSICGLGMLDETEIESIPDRAKQELPDFNRALGEAVRQEDAPPASETRRLSETHANNRQRERGPFASGEGPMTVEEAIETEKRERGYKPERTYADRRNPPEPPAAEDWEKRFGKQEPGEEG